MNKKLFSFLSVVFVFIFVFGIILITHINGKLNIVGIIGYSLISLSIISEIVCIICAFVKKCNL